MSVIVFFVFVEIHYRFPRSVMSAQFKYSEVDHKSKPINKERTEQIPRKGKKVFYKIYHMFYLYYKKVFNETT